MYHVVIAAIVAMVFLFALSMVFAESVSHDITEQMKACVSSGGEWVEKRQGIMECLRS